MNHQRGGYQVVVVGDETPVIWEPVTSITYEIRGTSRVKFQTAGKEKTMTTAWFAARAKRNSPIGEEWDIQHLKPHMIWQAQSKVGPVSKEAREAADKHGCTSATTEHGWTTGESWTPRSRTNSSIRRVGESRSSRRRPWRVFPCPASQSASLHTTGTTSRCSVKKTTCLLRNAGVKTLTRRPGPPGQLCLWCWLISSEFRWRMLIGVRRLLR